MQFTPMDIGEVYFYTATILNWKNLLKHDKYKQIIIDSLKYLTDKNKIAVYAYVIIPNHVHFIWEMLGKNGKEMPHASFFKHTGHCFSKDLQENHPHILGYFLSSEASRTYHFWERNPLPIWLYSSQSFEQKMEYIHNNPLSKKWNLSNDTVSYRFSSARFYAEGVDEFNIITDYRDRGI